MIINSIEQLIGNTPLLLIDESVHGIPNVNLYAKLEYYNPFGSVKDRVAKGMLDPILPELKANNKTVVEASSGNTAKALAALCGIHGLPFKTVTNRIKMPEVRMILQTLNADIQELPGLSDCPDPNDPNDFTTVATNMAKREPDLYHYTDQYFNKLNLQTHYETTGKEIADDLETVDYFIGVLGTCGSSMGAGTYLKEQKNTSILGVVADAGHNIPGGRNLNELWEVGFFTKDFYEEILAGTNQEAIDGMITLNHKAGMMCGPTTGLSYHAAIEFLKKKREEEPDGPEINAVFIACDRLEPYMSYIKLFKPGLFDQQKANRLAIHSLDPEDIKNAKKVTAEELESMKDPFIIDIRTRYAYSLGHIPGSMNMLDETLALLVEEGPAFPKNKPIVIACRIGTISSRFAAFLTLQGYDAYSLEGGVMAWKQQGKELIPTR